MSEVSKKKISESQKGKVITKEVREKISNTLKGKKPSKELVNKSVVNRKLKALDKGFFHSEETKKKIKEANKGHIVTESTRKKISDSGTKYTIKIFDEIIKLKSNSVSNQEISEKLKIPYNSIRNIIKKFNDRIT